MCHCLYFCRETDVIMPQLEEDELHHSSLNGQEQNRTCSTQPVSTELESNPITLTPNGHPSVSVKEVRITLRSSLYVDLFSKSLKYFEF